MSTVRPYASTPNIAIAPCHAQVQSQDMPKKAPVTIKFDNVVGERESGGSELKGTTHASCLMPHTTSSPVVILFYFIHCHRQLLMPSIFDYVSVFL